MCVRARNITITLCGSHKNNAKRVLVVVRRCSARNSARQCTHLLTLSSISFSFCLKSWRCCRRLGLSRTTALLVGLSCNSNANQCLASFVRLSLAPESATITVCLATIASQLQLLLEMVENVRTAVAHVVTVLLRSLCPFFLFLFSLSLSPFLVSLLSCNN